MLWLCVRIHPEVKYSLCRLAATTILSHTLLIQPHSSSQTTENRSVIFFLFSFLFFFSRLFILNIFISLPRHRYRAAKRPFEFVRVWLISWSVGHGTSVTSHISKFWLGETRFGCIPSGCHIQKVRWTAQGLRQKSQPSCDPPVVL